MKLFFLILLLFSCNKVGRGISSENTVFDPEAKEKLNKVEWKELFARILVKHILQDEFQAYPPTMKVKESVYFNRKSFENIYKEILSEPTSIGVMEKRDQVLSNDLTLKYLGARDIPLNDFFHTKALPLVQTLNTEIGKTGYGNYFKSALGQKILDTLQDTIFIILPGFGNHLIQEMVLPDLVEDLNLYYGRAKTRPYLPNLGFVDYREYYGQSSVKVKFDILQPMGKDVGSTFATHQEISQRLKDWINNLPAVYANKKIVFIGYSKGATLALQVVKDFAEIRERVQAVISLGGPLQGSTLADFLYKALTQFPTDQKWEDLVKLFADRAFKQSLAIKKMVERIPYLPQPLKIIFNNIFEAIFYDDLRVILKGLYEEGTQYMLEWNLKYLNQKYFDKPVSLFNLSFLANYRDFLLRGPVGEDGSKMSPEIVPQFNGAKFELSKFSLDSLAQIILSMNNQERIPGGLTDSMVNWNNSKHPVMDPTPLKESFSESLLAQLYDKTDTNRFSFQQFISMPRKEIFLNQPLQTVDFVDLGELRGTHWSALFRQVARIPGVEKSHVHHFPHKFMFESIIEVYAIYKLIRDEK